MNKLIIHAKPEDWPEAARAATHDFDRLCVVVCKSGKVFYLSKRETTITVRVAEEERTT